MPKAESSNPKNDPKFSGPRYRPNWPLASFCLLLGVLLIVAFAAYHPTQTKHIGTNPTEVNPVGWVGADTSFLMFYLLGGVSWLVPVFLLWMSYISVRRARHLAGPRMLVILLCLTCSSGLVAMQSMLFATSQTYTRGPGGWLGSILYQGALKSSMGQFGSAVVLSVVNILGFMFVFTRDVATEFDKIIAAITDWREKRRQKKALVAAAKTEQKDALSKQKAEVATAKAEAKSPAAAPPPPKKFSLPKAKDEPVKEPAKESVKEPKKEAAEPPAKPLTDQKAIAAIVAGKLNIVKPEAPKKAKAALPTSTDDDYKFPPITLLREQNKHTVTDEAEHQRNAENLLRILGEFGVNVTLGEIQVGPVITCYEVVPAAGVRVEKIAGLDKNIALGMRAQSVRILAPIPGKAAVGVEVPNQIATPVGMRELLESEAWVSTKAELPIALGKDVSGEPLISDLTKMPHLLIAGATGSGKSVCINSIIASIVYRASPKDVRLIMVDPKVVELKVFNSLPHMLIPVVTEPKKVPAALKWLLNTMEERYQIFAKVGVRNISGFNSRKKSGKTDFPVIAETQAELAAITPSADEIEIPERLHYIVAVIDELADLMMVAPAEIETSIARLAQLARAAGIHLIIATQRPSVNVITGIIKANLPSRIAFQVASQVDSRTILDGKGAETLIGRGDMLFTPPGTSKLVRAQGAFVSDEEITAIVEFLKVNGPPQYAQDVQAQIDHDPDAEEDADDLAEGDDDEMLPQAIDVLKSTRRASTSMLQRRLRIGYNRAARLMELMEKRGIVGPENGAQPRDILVDLETL